MEPYEYLDAALTMVEGSMRPNSSTKGETIMPQALTPATAYAQMRETLATDHVVRRISAAIRIPGLRAESITGNLLTYIAAHPDLLRCTRISILQCLMQCLALGLEPVGGLAYLVPFNTKNGRIAQLIIGYLGMIQLALRSPRVSSVTSQIVYPGEEFVWDKGNRQRELIHRPSIEDDRGEVQMLQHGAGPDRHWSLDGFRAAYMIGIMDGEPTIEVMRRQDIEKRMRKSQAARRGDGPWHTDTDMMVRKTVVRAGARYLAQQTNYPLLRAIHLDEQHERNEPQALEPFVMENSQQAPAAITSPSAEDTGTETASVADGGSPADTEGYHDF
jgi:recombination protein RecT